jgi:phosphate acetyltransferase
MKTGNPAALVFIPVCAGCRAGMRIPMKKLFGLTLALLMILTLSVPALAEENAPAGNAVPAMIDPLIELLKANPRKLIFTEGTDARILEAAARLKQDGFLTPVLIGNVDEVRAAAEKGSFDIEGLEIIDPAAYPDMDKLVDDFVTLRKGKATAEEAREMLLKPNYFGTMLVKEGLADALLGGATYSTADTVRPALQLIKTREGANLVSSCMILLRGDEKLAMGDCAINISYEDKLDDQGNVILSAAQQVAEVAVETARTAKLFGIDPKIAMLSFSTNGSAKGSGPEMMRKAAAIVKETHPELACDGEMQFDAAVAPEVGQLKFPGSTVAGYANTFIFPEIQSGNIGYKIAQRLGGFMAIGPILQGLNAPINDLSRGCNAEEVYLMSIITAAQGIE